MYVVCLMIRVSCPVSDVKVAFVSCDPSEKGMSLWPCLAWGIAWKRQIHEVLSLSHLMVGSVQQIGREKEWVAVECVVQIAESSREVDDADLKVMDSQGKSH